MLTEDGKLGMKSVGQQLSYHYSERLRFSSEVPARSEVQVKSSDYTRCIISTQCLLYGWFPKAFPSVIPGQLPELHPQTYPIETDKEMLWDSCPCRAAKHERLRLSKIGEEATFNREKTPFYQFLTQVSGKTVDNTTQTSNIYDRLFVAQRKGIPLPSWANDTVMAELDNIGANDFFFRGQSVKLQRLRTGRVFEDIVKHFSYSDDTIKLMVYSSHDGLLCVILNALQAYNPRHLIQYGAVIAFELYQEIHQENCPDKLQCRHVKVFYIKDPSAGKERTQIIIPGCGQRCYLQNFRKVLNALLIYNDRQWHRECANYILFPEN